jgi:hypothetical protein
MAPLAAVILGLGLMILGGILLLGSVLCQDSGHRRDFAAAVLWLSGSIATFGGWAEGTLGWVILVLTRTGRS